MNEKDATALWWDLTERFPERSCRVCGCTDHNCLGCIERTGKRCYWVEDDLCSACSLDHHQNGTAIAVEIEIPVRTDKRP